MPALHLIGLLSKHALQSRAFPQRGNTPVTRRMSTLARKLTCGEQLKLLKKKLSRLEPGALQENHHSGRGRCNDAVNHTGSSGLYRLTWHSIVMYSLPDTLLWVETSTVVSWEVAGGLESLAISEMFVGRSSMTRTAAYERGCMAAVLGSPSDKDN